MRSAKLYRYALPMDSGVILRNEKLFERQGFIIELNQDGVIGRGEVAPLPGFSDESMLDVEAQLPVQLKLWQQGVEIDYNMFYPLIAFGLSMAVMELQGELPPEGNFFAAPLCSGDPDDLIEKLSKMPGRKVAKVKVGFYEAVRDGLIVSLLLESIPDLSLRLDANRSWTLAKAEKFASKIAPSYRHRIAFIEEPCESPTSSMAFGMNSGIAIAWDETLQQSLKNPEFLLEDLTGVKGLIIKPSVIGSVQRCQYLIKKAQRLGMQAVISSSLESSLGLCQLARLSKWLLPDEVPGLDTVNLFKQQLEIQWPGCDLPLLGLESQPVIWSC
jgi:o-succinylbenzoate synthase